MSYADDSASHYAEEATTLASQELEPRDRAMVYADPGINSMLISESFGDSLSRRLYGVGERGDVKRPS
jgi:hypothetical protein